MTSHSPNKSPLVGGGHDGAGVEIQQASTPDNVARAANAQPRDMRLPFADELPVSLRRLGRIIVGRTLRQRIAAQIEHLAHLQYRQDPVFQQSRATLRGLHNIHRGKTCIVIGNGPSLKGHDLSALNFAQTFCLNRGYLIWNEQGLIPDYFVAVNDLVIEQFHDQISQLPCPKFLPWRHRALFAGSTSGTFIEMRWHQRFFENVESGLWPGATVTFAALQIAYHMGFSKVILIGVDHRFASVGQPNLEVIQNGHDRSHFTETYFANGVRWNLPDLELSAFAYGLAKQAYEADGRVIIDATNGGHLDVFPKMSLEAARQLSI